MRGLTELQFLNTAAAELPKHGVPQRQALDTQWIRLASLAALQTAFDYRVSVPFVMDCLLHKPFTISDTGERIYD